MNKLYVILILAFFSLPFLYVKADSGILDTTNIIVPTVEKEATLVKAKTSNAISAQRDDRTNTIVQCSCMPENRKMDVLEWLLVFLPTILFILVVGLLLLKGLKGFDFKEALKENELTKVIIQNPLYESTSDPQKLVDIPPTLEITANVNSVTHGDSIAGGGKEYTIDNSSSSYRASISRYIALISSLMILIIAICTSTFFIYHYIRTGCPPDLEGISTVLLALGIGIIPYAANKVSTAIATNKSEV